MRTKTMTVALRDRHVISLADGDNLWISSERIYNRKLSPSTLRDLLADHTSKFTPAVVLTTHPGMKYTTEAWRRGGWMVTAIDRRTSWTCRGPELIANADCDIAFEAGVMLASYPHADTLLLCTGDGTLASAIAADVLRRRPRMEVISAAIPGSASARLRDTALFSAFIELGEDITTGCPTSL